uniref:Transcription initiation factor TFIID subunit 8 n=1 Tax=Spongospora subterranea TaxID=70186 RepID=A0A0H5RAQ7_9EUKA|eukprot:CRZ10851.1 hypothetical protein [Spongospora subterranea]
MPSSTSSGLMLATVRIACAEILSELGYASVHDSALDTFSEVCSRYITEVAVLSKSNAELARRTHVTLWDSLNAINDLGTNVQSLLQYKKSSNNLPFIYDLLPFPQPREVIICAPTTTSDTATQNDPPPDLPVIPSYLPPLPAPHTYQFTPVYQKPAIDPNARRKMIIKQKRQVESSLVKLSRSMQQKDVDPSK